MGDAGRKDERGKCMSMIGPAHDIVDGDRCKKLEVSSAAHDMEPIIANLFELYAYDLSETFDLRLGPDGRYGYQSLPLYWKDPSRFPFLIKVEEHLAGFALVSRGSLISGDRNVWDMAEFFVLKRYRRLGVGATAARDIWRRFPGHWKVRVLETNRSAVTFWQATIDSFTGTAVPPVRIESGGEQRLCFGFQSPGSAAHS